MNKYHIRITVKTFNGIFKPTFRSYDFWQCAPTQDEAIRLVSASVPSRGYPQDEKIVEVLSALPINPCVALVPYDPRFHVFDWSTVADAAERALMNTCARLQRQNEATIQSVREATRVVRELTRELEAAA